MPIVDMKKYIDSVML